MNGSSLSKSPKKDLMGTKSSQNENWYSHKMRTWNSAQELSFLHLVIRWFMLSLTSTDQVSPNTLSGTNPLTSQNKESFDSQVQVPKDFGLKVHGVIVPLLLGFPCVSSMMVQQ